MAQIVIAYRNRQISPELIQKTLDFSDGFIQLSKTHSDQLIAQLHFYKPSLPYSLNLFFNQLLTTYLLAVRNQWNDTAIQQLLCCAISQFAGITKQLDEFSKNENAEINRKQISRHNKQLLQALNKPAFQIWFTGLKHAEHRWHLKPITILKLLPRQSRILRLLGIANCLGFLLTRTTYSPAFSFPMALKTITRHIPSLEYGTIESLLEYPGTTLPGTMAVLNDGRYLLVLTSSGDHFVGKRFYKEKNNCGNEIEHIPTQQIKKLLGPQPLKHLTHLDEWWDATWMQWLEENTSTDTEKHKHELRPILFRLDKPPPTLIAIQHHLQNDDFDANELADLIANEPVFATHIKNTATQSSREKLEISNVKHGLLLHGFERASSILMEHALTIRLNQHYFPLQESLLQFCTLYKHLSGVIAELSNKVTPELASCWAGFASSGVFTSVILKTRTALPTENLSGPRISQILPVEHASTFPHHAIKLAECWAQPAILTLAIQELEQTEKFVSHSRKRHHNISAILGMGLILTKYVYIADYDLTNEELEYLQKAMLYLGIETSSEAAIIQSALERAHSYSPIN